MGKILIYPFTVESFPLCEYIPVFLPNYQVSALATPPGSGVVEKDAAHISNRFPIGLIVQKDLDNALEKCDAVLVPFGDLNSDPMFYNAYEVMCKAAKNKKEIFCASRLSAAQIKYLNILDTFHYGLKEESTYLYKTVYGEYQPSVPVVFVHNLTMEADSFEVTLSLAQRFRRDGYRVSIVGARPEYTFLGFNASALLIDFFYGNYKLSRITEGMHLFQHYLHHIESIQNPDIILLNFPGGAVSTQDIYPNERGVFTYIMTQSIRPDFSVVCITNGNISLDGFSLIDLGLKEHFGIGADAFHISNHFVHIEQARLAKKERGYYSHVQETIDQIQRIRKNSDNEFPIFSAMIEEEKESLYQTLLMRLTQE